MCAYSRMAVMLVRTVHAMAPMEAASVGVRPCSKVCAWKMALPTVWGPGIHHEEEGREGGVRMPRYCMYEKGHRR
jgi:hypothetical protein